MKARLRNPLADRAREILREHALEDHFTPEECQVLRALPDEIDHMQEMALDHMSLMPLPRTP